MDGSGNITNLTFTELSLSLSGVTAGMYDLFAYNNSGSLAIEKLAWTNDTTRATAIARETNGLYYKSGDKTRLLLGSFYVHETGYCKMVFGGSDTAAYFGVCNLYNRTWTPYRTYQSASSWTYSSTGLSAWRKSNNNDYNRLDFVSTFDEGVMLDASFYQYCYGNESAYIGIGLDSSTANSTVSALVQVGYAALFTPYRAAISVGKHYAQAIERNYHSGTGASTFYGGSDDQDFSGMVLI
jgi:hypothetical protein